jgi:hypothetical protein
MTPPFETWLSIGGLTLHLSTDDPRLASPGTGALREFFCEPRAADVVVDASWGDTGLPSDGIVLFESGGAWRLLRAGSELVFACRSSLHPLDEPYAIARFDGGLTRGSITMSTAYWAAHPESPAFPLDYPLDEVVFVHLLSQGKGVEVHGCGVLDAEGRAFVFAGQSGAGKSTLSRWWAERNDVTVLSDERVVIRTDRDPIMVYGTPWHGDAELASPRCGPLAGLFFLHQAPTHGITPISRSQAAARLFSCAFLPFYDRARVSGTADAIARVIGTMDAAVLSLAADRSVIEFLAASGGERGAGPLAPATARPALARTPGRSSAR